MSKGAQPVRWESGRLPELGNNSFIAMQGEALVELLAFPVQIRGKDDRPLCTMFVERQTLWPMGQIQRNEKPAVGEFAGIHHHIVGGQARFVGSEA